MHNQSNEKKGNINFLPFLKNFSDFILITESFDIFAHSKDETLFNSSNNITINSSE